MISLGVGQYVISLGVGQYMISLGVGQYIISLGEIEAWPNCSLRTARVLLPVQVTELCYSHQ